MATRLPVLNTEQNAYKVIDYRKTLKNIQIAITLINHDDATMSEINQILKNSIVHKIIRQKSIKFWTPQLKQAVRKQNRARKAIGRARRKNTGTSEPYRMYKIAQDLFRKLFKKAKREYNVRQIQKACQDPTGAEFYKVIKQLQPKLNKKARPHCHNDMEAEEETEKIAQHFEAIFGQNDVKPTIEEEAKLKSNIDTGK